MKWVSERFGPKTWSPACRSRPGKSRRWRGSSTLDAKVVVFDEPTARLSAAGRSRLFSVIDGLRRAGKMVVFVSHYLEEIFGVADRIVVLRDGRLAGDCKNRDIDIPGLIKLMLGDVEVSARNEDIQKGEAILTVRGLTSEPRFRNVDFEVRSFEVLGITGIIGSGRHEVVRSLIGEHDARGSVEIGGRQIQRSSAATVVGRHLGFVPEDRKRDGIIPYRSVSDNLSLPWLRKLSAAGIVRNSASACARARVDRTPSFDLCFAVATRRRVERRQSTEGRPRSVARLRYACRSVGIADCRGRCSGKGGNSPNRAVARSRWDGGASLHRRSVGARTSHRSDRGDGERRIATGVSHESNAPCRPSIFPHRY